MALYNRGSLNPTASVGSQGYRTAARQHFQADLDPARRQAQLELADEYGGRGLSPSGGQAIAARLGNRNSYVQQLLQQDQKLGVGQADAGEAARQAIESRGWQEEDRLKQQALEDEFTNLTAEDYAAYRAGVPLRKLFGGVGSLAGTWASGGFRNLGQGQMAQPAGGYTYQQLQDRGQGAAPVVDWS